VLLFKITILSFHDENPAYFRGASEHGTRSHQPLSAPRPSMTIYSIFSYSFTNPIEYFSEALGASLPRMWITQPTLEQSNDNRFSRRARAYFE